MSRGGFRFPAGLVQLVEIKGLAEIGHNLVASTRVLTWIAFTLAIYYFLRFIGDAFDRPSCCENREGGE